MLAYMEQRGMGFMHTPAKLGTGRLPCGMAGSASNTFTLCGHDVVHQKGEHRGWGGLRGHSILSIP